ncbi:hypothetical protein TCARB_1317 [Thermofilum adornatum 1505]|uniref:Uncharacterized protein n=1 Tax=Thermofilum adornatum 1505 TaxID=697581 RepID=A0A3G1A7Y4_9CREN|nr:hypothetical protein TCARB_1317 [Thermofilum adornatum 1505]
MHKQGHEESLRRYKLAKAIYGELFPRQTAKIFIRKKRVIHDKLCRKEGV